MTKNLQVVLASRPQGPVTESNFQLVERDIPAPGPGEVLVRNHWLSLDPYMRGRMSASKSYAAAVEIGDVMVGGTVGEVITSNHPRHKAGDFVVGSTGWQLYAVATGESLNRVDPDLVPLSAYLGIVGMPGATAWIGLYQHCEPIAGETVVVSAASGAVGSVVGQLARRQGCRTVGIAGGKSKCEYVVKELGFDACIDYKAGRLYEDLKHACPSGVDCYFENVAGPTMDTVFRVLNPFSRIALCGMIADYNSEEPYGVRMMRSLLVNRVRLTGFIVNDRMDLYQRAIARLGALVSQGELKYRESVAEGLQNAPTAFIGLLAGRNFGKQVVKLV